MASIQIMLRDTKAGLVDVETTIGEGWEADSNAVALAGRITKFLNEIAKPQGEVESRSAPKLELVKA